MINALNIDVYISLKLMNNPNSKLKVEYFPTVFTKNKLYKQIAHGVLSTVITA